MDQVRYAARVGAELGIDFIKTHYTGSAESFAAKSWKPRRRWSWRRAASAPMTDRPSCARRAK